MNNKSLILGLGNDILSDDGIGPRLIIDLAEIFIEPDLHFKASLGGGLQIAEEIRNYQRVLFIDAIKTINGSPGDVYYLTPGRFKETLHICGIHDIDFLTALRLGEKLLPGFPSDLHIIAIEIQECRIFGDELTPLLKEKYNEILQKVINLIIWILQEDNKNPAPV